MSRGWHRVGSIGIAVAYFLRLDKVDTTPCVRHKRAERERTGRSGGSCFAFFFFVVDTCEPNSWESYSLPRLHQTGRVRALANTNPEWVSRIMCLFTRRRVASHAVDYRQFNPSWCRICERRCLRYSHIVLVYGTDCLPLESSTAHDIM